MDRRRSDGYIVTLISFSGALMVLISSSPSAWAGPLTPQEALAAFQTLPDLTVELVASEPAIQSPVALTFDEAGRLYVAENRGYPTGPAEGQPPLGRITLLEDRDADGKFERQTVFADGLTFPNGVLPWAGGLIVSCAPDILYLKDTDGDGRADERSVWLTGFSTKGSTQLRVSHPTLGLDGWIYVTSGLTGGEVSCPSHPDLPIIKYGREDLRFRPDLSTFETCDGGGQFGQSFDGFGRRFTCYNRVQAQHVVLSSRDLKRNPRLPFSQTLQDCPLDMTPEPAKGHGASARLYPISSNVTTADSHAGTFTAACSVLIWRGNGLPDAFNSAVFSCDPTGNLVHVDRLEPRNVTFGVRAGAVGREFLASPDDWCRPVFVAHGPDGALYVCDMYRKTIEHPDYLPVEIRKRTDFESGKGMGRIWRVRASDRPLAAMKNYGTTANDLVDRLRDQRGAGLTTVLRLFLSLPREMQLEVLRNIDPAEAIEWPAENYVVWLRMSDAVGQLTDRQLIVTLQQSTPAVREHGLLLASERREPSGELLASIFLLANDVDPRVRFQWALWAGRTSASIQSDERISSSLASIALRNSDDRWTRAAVLSAITNREAAFLTDLSQTCLKELGERPEAPVFELTSETGRVLGADPSAAVVAKYAAQVLEPEDRHEDLPLKAGLLSGIAESLRGRGLARDGGSPLLLLLDDPSVSAESKATVTTRWPQLVEQAAAICGDGASPDDRRRWGIAILAQSDTPKSADVLLELAVNSQSHANQSATIRSLGALTADAIPIALLNPDRFIGYTPSLREEVLSTLLSSRRHRLGVLLALENGAVPTAAVDSLRRGQLMGDSDPAVKERANKLFGLASAGDRAKVYEAYKSCLELPPQPDHGRAVFKRLCTNCHRLDREGVAVGPDLFGIRNQPKEAILLHVLIPEREIAPNFTTYVVETKSGRVFNGLLASESSSGITLKQALGKEETILKTEIENIVASKLSLMPQELEKQITRQEFSDLIAYLKGEASPQ